MYSSTRISGAKAKKLIDKGAILIDTRSPVEFRDGTLPGAVNVSVRQVSSLMKHPRKTKLVFFGDSDVVESMINYANGMGFVDVFTFGTLDNWNDG